MKVIVALGKASNQSFAFPLSEKGNKHNFIAFGSTFFVRIISHISVNVFKCKPEFLAAKLQIWFC
jgi:hypothetical protein